jgi:uncharacterized membrane protein
LRLLITGIAIFGGIHLFGMLLPRQRDALRAAMGPTVYKGTFALVSVVGFGLAIWGFAGTRSGPDAADWIYFPPDWARHVTMLLVLLAFISLGASHGRGYLKLWLRQPMSIGIALWAGGHLLANGKRADVILFGFLLLLAIADIVLSNLRGKIPHHQPQVRSDIAALLAGAALYLLFLFWFHPYVLNLPVVG